MKRELNFCHYRKTLIANGDFLCDLVESLGQIDM